MENYLAAGFNIKDVFQPAKIKGYESSTGVAQLFSDLILILIGLSGTLALIFIIIAGIKIITASGDSKKLQSASQTLMYAIIGFAISILAFVILKVVQYFLKSNIPI